MSEKSITQQEGFFRQRNPTDETALNALWPGPVADSLLSSAGGARARGSYRKFRLNRYRAFLASIPEMFALLLLGTPIAILGCGSKQAPEGVPAIPVKASPVRRSAIQQQITSAAVVYPLHQAAIVPKISAPIEKFYVQRGDDVHAGQLVAVLENGDLAAAVAETKGTYEQAQANYESVSAANLPDQLEQARAAVTRARVSFKAAQQLYESSEKLYQQGALAERQVNEAQVGLAQAQTRMQTSEQHLDKLQSVQENAQLKEAQGQLAAAKGRYESAQAQMGFSEIKSPIDGVVASRPLVEGEMANSGSPLMTIVDLSRIVARAHIPAPEAATLKVGDPAEISVPGESKPLPGKVIVVSPALDPDSTTLQVWVEAPNRNDLLKPGSTTSVTITSARVPDALVIPQSALLSANGRRAFVMVIGSDHVAHRTMVETGIEQGDLVQITQGLQGGELIVSQGAYGLPDGAKVTY